MGQVTPRLYRMLPHLCNYTCIMLLLQLGCLGMPGAMHDKHALSSLDCGAAGAALRAAVVGCFSERLC